MEIELFQVVVNTIEFFVEFNRLGIPGRVVHNAPLHTARTSLQSDLEKNTFCSSIIALLHPLPRKIFPDYASSKLHTTVKRQPTLIDLLHIVLRPIKHIP